MTAKPPWPKDTLPDPPHSSQRFHSVPGAPPDPLHVAQSSVIGTDSDTFPPLAAVRKSTSTLYSTLRPLRGPFGLDGCPFFPRSKIEEKMSEKPPSPPRSSKEKPPDGADGAGPLRGAPRTPPKPKVPSFRIWSYFFRLAGSERTELASPTSLKRSAAFGLFRLASGW